MAENYAALIIDLVDSRGYTTEKREHIQKYIIESTTVLNNYFAPDLKHPMDFSAGDEIQGLFYSPQAAYLYYRLFSICIHPISIRAGIGVGELTVQIPDKGTTSQDGPAYHYARNAINNADSSKGYPVLFFSKMSSDITINTIIGGAATIISEQSTRQNQLMLLTEVLSPLFSRALLERESIDSRIHALDLWESKNNFHYTLNQISPETASPIDAMIKNAPTVSRLVSSFGNLLPVIAEDSCKKEAFYITDGRARGLPTVLSSILGISRQTIEKTLQAGNIYISRNMSIAALNEMTKVFAQ